MPCPKRFLVQTAIVLLLAVQVRSATIEEEMPALVEALAKQLVEQAKPKVAALDFTDIQGRPNELGRFLAEQLAVDMVLANGVTVVDRANLNAIMAEHELTAEGLVKPENAKKLGQFAGVDAILIGNIASMDNKVVLTIKAISTKSSEVVAAGRMRFDISKDIQRMLGLKVGSATSAGIHLNSKGASVADIKAIATREIGPLMVVLRNAVKGSEATEAGSMPVITCTFDLENRHLDRQIAVAANQIVVPDHNSQKPNTSGYRGSIYDSSVRRWLVPPSGLKGVSSVYCFEAEPYLRSAAKISQNNPSAIASYIRRGNYYDFSSFPRTGMHWAGGFTNIPPGESIRLTVSFARSDFLIKSRSSIRSSDPSSDIEWPDEFQLDLELVIGKYGEDEEPHKSRDLALRNLTIDRILLPKVEDKR